MRRRKHFTLVAGASGMVYARVMQKRVPFSGLGNTMTFDQQWTAARYNWQYWASYAGMFIAPLVGATFVALYLRRRPVARRAWHIILALFVFLLTAEITVDSIGRKWESRVAAARTYEENQAVATRDLNLMFAPIIGGLCGAA